MYFGWTDEYILNMNATRFFSMLSSAKKTHFKNHSRMMHDMCFASSISGCSDQEYINRVIAMFKDGYVEKPKSPAIKPRGTTHQEMSDILQGICKLKLRAEYGG